MTIHSFKTLTVTSPEPHVILLTLNRPEFSNAFNSEMALELVTFFEEISMDFGDTRVVVITGAGDRAFCAGGDLKERDGMSNDAWAAQHLIYERMVRAVLGCPLPTIGAINGAAYGGGCELAAAFDFAFASVEAKFAQTEVKIGIIPGAGGTQTLTRAVGEKRAKELILSGQVFSARQALDWGLVNDVFEQTDLLPHTIAIAAKIAANAPIAVRQAKQAIGRGASLSLSDGLAFEIEAYNRTIPTEDRREGVRAFNKRRAPVFKGS